MILAHSRWKTRFQRLIASPDEQLDLKAIAKDDQCELGKWIWGEGAAHAGLGEYDHLKACHARFHQAAAAVARQIYAGSPAEAQEMLDPLKGSFGRASSECVSAIAALRNQLMES